MERVQYYVVKHNGEWKIGFQGRHYGPYATQKEAIRYAVEAANKNRGDARVVVQGDQGKFRLEWTYGSDLYPPEG